MNKLLKSSKGEIAMLLTIVSTLLLISGLVAGNKLANNITRSRSLAQNNPPQPGGLCRPGVNSDQHGCYGSDGCRSWEYCNPQGACIDTTNSGSQGAVEPACGYYIDECSSSSECTKCILNNRKDILKEFSRVSWDIKCENHNTIANNWCTTVNPSDCSQVKTASCSSVCESGGNIPTPTPTQTGGGGGGGGGGGIPTPTPTQTGGGSGDPGSGDGGQCNSGNNNGCYYDGCRGWEYCMISGDTRADCPVQAGWCCDTTNNGTRRATGNACGFTQNCSDIDACEKCIFDAEEILQSYSASPIYWDIGCRNQQNIFNNWCGSVNPAKCNELKAGSCQNQCQGGGSLPPVNSPTPTPTVQGGNGGTQNKGSMQGLIFKVNNGMKGIKDIDVNIYKENDELYSTVKTNNDGIYNQGNMPTGKYYLKITLPEGYNFKFPLKHNKINFQIINGNITLEYVELIEAPVIAIPKKDFIFHLNFKPEYYEKYKLCLSSDDDIIFTLIINKQSDIIKHTKIIKKKINEDIKPSTGVSDFQMTIFSQIDFPESYNADIDIKHFINGRLAGELKDNSINLSNDEGDKRWYTVVFNKSKFLDCIHFEAPLSSQSISNLDFEILMERYRKGEIDSRELSRLLNEFKNKKLMRVSGLQRSICDPFLPAGYEGSCNI